jgi:ribonuclease Z
MEQNKFPYLQVLADYAKNTNQYPHLQVIASILTKQEKESQEKSTPKPPPIISKQYDISPIKLYRLEDCPIYQLKGGWTVQGSSKAGYRTGYYIQNINIIVDCGFSTDKEPTAIFMTHRHTDHFLELPKMVSYRVQKKGQEKLLGRPIVLPNEEATLTGLKSLVEAVQILSGGMRRIKMLDNDLYKRAGIQPFAVNYDTKHQIPGVPNIVVEVVRAYHDDCMSVGYGFNEIRKGLKPEYSNLKGSEIAELRKKGMEVSEEKMIPMVLIYGDTTPDALVYHEEWKKYPNVFIECTSCEYEEDNLKAVEKIKVSRERGHTHINDLLPTLIKFKEGRRWFIHHTSKATDMDKLRNLLKRFNLFEPDCIVIE